MSESASHAPVETPVETDATYRNRRLLVLCIAVVVVMLTIGVPVLTVTYNMVCSALGVGQNPQNDPLNASPAVVATAGTDDAVVGERQLRVYFEGRALDGLPVLFFPDEKVQDVVVGKDVHNLYRFKNTSNEIVRFRPIHTVTPSFAAQSYSMKVCFCFNDQEIEPGGEETFEVVYRFNEDLDERITFAKIRYDLHPITAEDMRPQKTQEEALNNE